jgi:hypothetical protein
MSTLVVVDWRAGTTTLSRSRLYPYIQGLRIWLQILHVGSLVLRIYSAHLGFGYYVLYTPMQLLPGRRHIGSWSDDPTGNVLFQFRYAFSIIRAAVVDSGFARST